jgi:hypothetical protein
VSDPLAARDGRRPPTQPSSARPRLATLGLSAALFVLTFALYWVLGPKQTAYDYQLSQANNIVHGHLDMTAQYTRNLAVLERVLFDGTGFCLPADDPRGVADIVDPRITPDCRTYMQHSLGPAFLLVPLVLIWGANIDQTLISVLIAAATAPVVFAITRRFSDRLSTQLALTVLVMFGTILWWVGANGGVWFFAHTTAVFFLFCAIYATVAWRNPLLAGALVGAAFLCRPTTILAGFFPFVALSDQWLVAAPGQPFWRRIRPGPLVWLAVGVAPFVATAMTVNELRFGNPFENGYDYSEEFHQISLQPFWDHGIFSVSYIARHVAVVLEQMPNFGRAGSYVWPSWAGLAMWATTPPLLYGLFAHLKAERRLARWVAAALAVASAVILSQTVWRELGLGAWGDAEIPLGIQLLPFWMAIALAVGLAARARDRLVLACWAAIIPIALANWLFAATGWAQFGYRYGLDFTPFLFLLVVVAVGRQVRWHHVALIAAAVIVNLWGVLWIYQFAPADLLGWTWVSF